MYLRCGTDWIFKYNLGYSQSYYLNFLFEAPSPLPRHTLPINLVTGTFSARLKRLWREEDHWPTPWVEKMNMWSYTSIPFILLHSLNRNNVTLPLLIICLLLTLLRAVPSGRDLSFWNENTSVSWYITITGYGIMHYIGNESKVKHKYNLQMNAFWDATQ